MGLTGVKVIAHKSTDMRLSWSPHRHYVYYIGLTFKYYRYYEIINKTTKKEIITDTLEFTEDNVFKIPCRNL